MWTTTVDIGADPKHTLRIAWSPFGLETYSVDGVQVLRMWSWARRTTRRLRVGDHDVEVVIDFSFPRMFFSDHRAELIVDGHVQADLARLMLPAWMQSEGKARSIAMVKTMAFVLVFIVTCFLIALVYGALAGR